MASDYILIVEDDPDIREALQEVLESEDFATHTCRNGLEALEHLRESAHLPKLIILDLMMPVMSGQEFLKALGLEKPARFNRIPVVVFTAAGEKAETEVENPTAVLRKPIELAPLMDAVRRFYSSP